MTPEFKLRNDILEAGRRIWQRGYVAASDGNLSARLPDGRILITPTGRSKGFLQADELVVVDASGKRVSGRLEPTSEMKMHLFVYEARPDVMAVVHAHPPKATGFAVAGVHLAQCVLPEVILTLGGVPLAEYATPSTPEVPASIEKYIRTYNAMLLRSHGVLTLGSSVLEAYYRMETVEHFAEITLAAKALGGASPLSDEEVQKLLRAREKLGIKGPVGSCVSCGSCDRHDAAAGETETGEAAERDKAPVPPVGAASGQSLPRRPESAPQADVTQSGTNATESDEDIVEAVLARLRGSLSGTRGASGEGGMSE